MKSKHQFTKTHKSKVETMRKLKAAYDEAKAKGTVKSYKVNSTKNLDKLDFSGCS